MTGTGLVTLGETMAALAPDRIGPLRHASTLGLAVAGSESTVAIGVRRLGHPAAWIGRVGADELGELVTSRLRAESVTVHATADPAAPTGLMLKERRTAALRRVHYYRAGSAGSRLTPADLPAGLIESADLLHATGITPALSDTAAASVRTAIDRAHAASVPVSYDLNHRNRLWSWEEARAFTLPLLPRISLLFASEDEAELLLGHEPGAHSAETLAQELRKLGPETVVITMGADGAVAADSSGTTRISAVPVPEIDPVGAGDSFVAGYLAALLSGADPGERLDQAARVAAWSVATEGDWEGLPTAAELPLTAAPPGTVAR
ncbi:sugar kinase [Streptomyces beijiangensis]|uniref:Sugar kinase n=1 Tax=Streptomyces beijiangensis TaxID=163361 RepID=A0A939F0P0_9ACTN|nr:sugar kinase [Streptomyces beijiangensis]MBO0510351.1 sugar kinase [Streptomyces beijiangensis]